MVEIGASGAVTPGENAAEFAAVCSLVQFAKAKIPPASEPQEIQKIINTLSAINFTLMDEQTRSTVEKNKEKNWEQIQSEHTGETKYYGDHWDKWTRVAKLPPTDPEALALKDWERHRANENLKQQIKSLLHEALNLVKEAATSKEDLKAANLERLQELALYGSAGKSAELKSADDRKGYCGKGTTDGTAAGVGATDSLYATILCLCAGAATDNTAGKGCCLDCQSGANAAAWTAHSSGKDRAEFLASKCPAALIPEHPTTPELNHRLGAFYKLALGTTSTTQTVKYNVGKVSGTGEGGCDGEVTGTSGRCAKYTAQQILQDDASLKWRQSLKAAATLYDKQAQAKITTYRLADKLRLINATAAALYHTPLTQTQIQPMSRTDAATKPTTNCSEHKSSKTTCENTGKCEWEENATDKSKGECKPKAGEGQTNTAAGDREGAAAANAEYKNALKKKDK
uniref:Variant surface glycoprotein 1125.4796 n=1 Tax=Trypanosoma brucei TaxID=5691 RepID=A0A1J0RAT8_9TRYP|nr:variant surface glycoprotein 1125.4796 [Trypanosoma brucei]